MDLKADIEAALRSLVGLPMWGPTRAANMLSLQFGEPRLAPTRRDPTREAGERALNMFCPWRLVRGRELIAGSGDLYTPADAEADLESFDWDARGATWWDRRLGQFFAAQGEPLVVRDALADPIGGFTLSFDGNVRIEVFPASAAAPHVETEHWRLFGPGTSEAHFVVTADGIYRDAAV
jgi:hypothetical protein